MWYYMHVTFTKTMLQRLAPFNDLDVNAVLLENLHISLRPVRQCTSTRTNHARTCFECSLASSPTRGLFKVALCPPMTLFSFF